MKDEGYEHLLMSHLLGKLCIILLLLICNKIMMLNVTKHANTMSTELCLLTELLQCCEVI